MVIINPFTVMIRYLPAGTYVVHRCTVLHVYENDIRLVLELQWNLYN